MVLAIFNFPGPQLILVDDLRMAKDPLHTLSSKRVINQEVRADGLESCIQLFLSSSNDTLQILFGHLFADFGVFFGHTNQDITVVRVAVWFEHFRENILVGHNLLI